MKRILILSLVLLLIPVVLSAKQRKDVPPAPLPEAILNAKKIFLANGGGSNLAYDAFYAKMKDWGRFQIVGSPDEADVIMELAYKVDDHGTRVWSTTNTYNNTTQVHSAQLVDPQVILTVFDGKNKQLLWSTTDHRRLARREGNREKETINSAERIADLLKNRSELAQY